MKLYSATDDNIQRAAELIRAGGLVAFPTETVYGLGADGLNSSASAGIFEAKKRPFFDPLILHIALMDSLFTIAEDPDSHILSLAQKFWPGPLTIVVKKKSHIPDIVTSGLDTVAVRMPDHPVAKKLIELSGTPIAAPSANRFGSISPTSAEHVARQLHDSEGMILDGGQCHVGIESTIISASGKGITLLRPGGIPVEAIEEAAGIKVTVPGQGSRPQAPGQLPYHYSPEKPVNLVDRITADIPGAGLLFFMKPSFACPDGRSLVLSETGDLREAAANLFAHLHRLDSMEIDFIYAERVPEKGLGLGIMDRLTKASMKKHLI
ncbi:MAG TPA: L-threonylcarbamoyladenylate synthase [Spirochaetota bacterium]|nr:L-threonylcarbamoyladenylate synthase [Spirochaetota bacterium]